MKVYFNLASQENVLSLKYLASLNGVTVIMDTSKENEINIKLKNGNTLVFKECNDG